MKRSNTITAVFFLVFLAAMALLTCLGLPSIWTDLVQGWQNQEDPSDRSLIAKAVYVTEHTEAALNETLDGSHLFIQLYGGVQRLAGRRDGGGCVVGQHGHQAVHRGADLLRPGQPVYRPHPSGRSAPPP